MNHTANAYLLHLMRRAESSAQSNLMRVRTAASLREVVTLQEADVPPEIRAIRHTVPALRHLEQAAEQRARELVDTHLRDLELLRGDDLQKAIAHYRRNEWCFLRGNFPALAMRVEHALHTFKNTGEPA